MPETDDAPLPRPGSNAALEARVARLERQFDTLTGTVNAMAVDVAVSRTQLTGLERTLVGIGQDMKGFTASMREAIADPAVSPAGRIVLKELAAQRLEGEEVHKELVGDMKDVQAKLDRNTIWIAAASAVITSAIVVLNLFAPVLRGLLNLP